MPRFTVIARVSDHLPLAASMEEDKDQDQVDLEVYKTQSKRIIKQLTTSSPDRCTIESGSFAFHYTINAGVVFLVFTEKSYPKRLAYNYLDELSKEFSSLYSAQIDGVSRPYAFIKFDTFIQKTKKLYLDTRAQRNLKILNDDLQDVHRIMTKNIQEVLGRGDRLSDLSDSTRNLSSSSAMFKQKARDLNRSKLWEKYGVIGVVAAVVIFVLWLYFR